VAAAGIRSGGGGGGAIEEDDEDNAVVPGEEKEQAGANYRKRCAMCCTKLLEAGHIFLRPPPGPSPSLKSGDMQKRIHILAGDGANESDQE
jgi:hypothetical protein